ncbi:MAG: S8 family serine peptidase [Butyricimonas paravirosa]
MKKLEKEGSDGRKEIVGDNYLDINDDKYGNNVLLTSDAAIGTMQAGIIGAKRGNGLGGDGIMDQAEIMTLRVTPGKGEPYLKDMALAIRYAVDHKADVIVLPEQNTFYPEVQKKWVIEAGRMQKLMGYCDRSRVGIIKDLSKETFPESLDGGDERVDERWL